MKDIDHTLWEYDCFFRDLEFLGEYLKVCHSTRDSLFYIYFSFMRKCSYF